MQSFEALQPAVPQPHFGPALDDVVVEIDCFSLGDWLRVELVDGLDVLLEGLGFVGTEPVAEAAKLRLELEALVLLIADHVDPALRPYLLL